MFRMAIRNPDCLNNITELDALEDMPTESTEDTSEEGLEEQKNKDHILKLHSEWLDHSDYVRDDISALMSEMTYRIMDLPSTTQLPELRVWLRLSEF